MEKPNIIEAIGVNSNAYKTEKGRMKPTGIMLHSVGTPQPSAAVFKEKWSRPGAAGGIHYVLDGSECYHCYPDNYVGWHAGGAANKTHIGVETTEPATIKYTGGASYVDNDPAASKAHVAGVYANAVKVFAHLCAQYNLNPLADGVIISHKEGNQRGVASAHADIEHLWPRYGYTMDGFRRDVAAALGGELPEPEQTDQERIARVVAAEARGECYEGQLAVTQCIYDRLNDKAKRFGKDLTAVLAQFAAPWDGDLSTTTCAQAVADIFGAAKRVYAEACLWVLGKKAKKETVDDRNAKYVYLGEIGGQRFWGDNKPAEKPAAEAARPILQMGSRGAYVEEAQRRLLAHGQYLPDYGADGIFGLETRIATCAFQSAQGITVDGIIGPVTWGRLLRT